MSKKLEETVIEKAIQMGQSVYIPMYVFRHEGRLCSDVCRPDPAEKLSIQTLGRITAFNRRDLGGGTYIFSVHVDPEYGEMGANGVFEPAPVRVEDWDCCEGIVAIL